ncbi:MAG: PEP-CTERM sorting domain-containing protein [Isosphaeraceae bacterium]|nr:PEP-CTERM sorting domain-containing protein [Isosphaeraceae bacterium]
MRRDRYALFLMAALLSASSAVDAAQYAWTDWQTSSGQGGFTANGVITTATDTVGVVYHNPLSVSFFQNGVSGDLTDYFQNNRSGRNPARSPYTSSIVENIPTAAEMIALNRAGTQTLTFSKPIANPVFSFVSLNSNGYAFDQDFDLLSFGDGVVRDGGFWGRGTASKQVVDIGGGVLEYRLVGTGEPHGTLRFRGAFSTVSWRSLTNENWNGFTVGIEGTAAEIFTPEPSTFAAAGLGAAALFAIRRRRVG